MSLHASVGEDDPFWVVQLSSSSTAETKPFESGALQADYEVCGECDTGFDLTRIMHSMIGDRYGTLLLSVVVVWEQPSMSQHTQPL